MEPRGKEPSIPHRDIVKNIFDRPKSEKRSVSSIFTYFKHSQKVISPQEKPPPSMLKPLPAAIDIGTFSIKLVKLSEGVNKRLEVASLDEEPVGPDTAAALKKIIERNRVSGACLLALGAKEVQFYNMTFPPMSDSELAAAIKYKIAQLRPFNLNIENVVYNSIKHEQQSPIASSQTRVLVACASKKNILEKIMLLKTLDLEPVAVEAAPYCILNLSKFYKPPALKDAASLWLDIGHNESLLAIEKDGALYFTRNLISTSAQMTQAIAQHGRISIDAADALKKEYGFSYWSPDKKILPFFESMGGGPKTVEKDEAVYYALISLLENLVVDIEHTFKHFSYQIAQSQITKYDHVFISGGGAVLKNLDLFLGARLGVPVERVNILKIFGIRQGQEKDAAPGRAAFAVCAGLALGQRLDESKRVNLLPAEERKALRLEAVSEALKEKPVRIAVALLAIALIILGIQIGRAGYYKSRMDIMTKRLKDSKVGLTRSQGVQLKLAKEEGEIKKRRELLKARLELLKSGYRAPDDFAAVLDAIAEILPEEIWVNELLYKEGKISITGSTADIKLISRLIEKIRGREEFVGADFSYTQKEPSTEVYTFEIIAQVKG